jgi:hypothetical protein
MPVSHAPVPSRAPDAAAGQDQAPGLLEGDTPGVSGYLA